MKIEIACPKCDWEPDAGDKWLCTCSYMWNTFETAGKCPNCSKRWMFTQCLQCSIWSKHIDWYRNLDDDLKNEVREIFEEKITIG